MEKSGAEKSDLTSKIEELNLHNEISNKELRNIITKYVWLDSNYFMLYAN